MDDNSRAFQEQLHGLLDLLQAVGIHDVEHDEVRKASLALKQKGLGAPMVFPADIPEAKEINDGQIDAMILKLQQADAHTPGLMEALEDYMEQQKPGAKKKTTRKKATKKKTYQPKKQYAFVQAYQQQQQQPDDDEHGDEDENDNAHNGRHEPPIGQQAAAAEQDYLYDPQEADYPMVGPGMGDDVSVVSDMTTPTVVSSRHVEDDENYNDIVRSPFGGGAIRVGQQQQIITGGKKKNLVSGVVSLHVLLRATGRLVEKELELVRNRILLTNLTELVDTRIVHLI